MNNHTGWICPRCSDVNAPTVKVCGCNIYKDRYRTPFTVPDVAKYTDGMFKTHPDSVTYTSGSSQG